MGCCAGKLQFHKETKRQDKNEYLAAARAVETGAGLTKDVHMDMGSAMTRGGQSLHNLLANGHVAVQLDGNHRVSLTIAPSILQFLEGG